MKFINLLRKLTYYSDHPKHRMSCVIARGNRIISVGFNKVKTHPRSNTPFKCTHAELDAILGCSREELDGADIYIFRQNKNGIPACARPCYYCYELLKAAGIKNVSYSDDGSFKKERVI